MKPTESQIRQFADDLQQAIDILCECETSLQRAVCAVNTATMDAALQTLLWVLGEHPPTEEFAMALRAKVHKRRTQQNVADVLKAELDR